LIGELIISSKAGTTLPEALTLTSITLYRLWKRQRSFASTPALNTDISTPMTIILATPWMNNELSSYYVLFDVPL
jgi:hypothetical protein